MNNNYVVNSCFIDFMKPVSEYNYYFTNYFNETTNVLCFCIVA